MLGRIQLTGDERVLDLGCGYGLVGIAVAKVIGQDRVTMVDNDEVAAKLTRTNARINGVPAIRVRCGAALWAVPEERFSLVLLNPPTGREKGGTARDTQAPHGTGR